MIPDAAMRAHAGGRDAASANVRSHTPSGIVTRVFSVPQEVTMPAVQYGSGRVFDEPYDQLVPRVRAALKAEGFGVITEIDVQQTMKEKLGIDGRPHVILGACNPKFAHEALAVEDDLGLLLPCNVVVYEKGEGSRVAVINAGAMMGFVGNDGLAAIAAEVQARLDRVLASL
jgi:uncharacterized protein (DUF302 family)